MARKTLKQLEKLFLEYAKHYPDRELISCDSVYTIEFSYQDRDGEWDYHTIRLSGHYDQRSGRVTHRGNITEAYAELEELIAKAKAEREKQNGS